MIGLLKDLRMVGGVGSYGGMNEPSYVEVKADQICRLNGKGKQCCCNCKHHLPVNRHCWIDGRIHDECVCGERKGWACVPPGFGRVHDNWPEHDYGCEMYEAKQEVAK